MLNVRKSHACLAVLASLAAACFTPPDSETTTSPESDELGTQSSALSSGPCRRSDRGKLVGYELVASYPTKAAARAYLDSFVDLYREFGYFTGPLSFDIDYGFDSYQVSYCTIDAELPGQSQPSPTVATGMVSVPRKSGRLATVAYMHGTSVSFYDAPSNPSIDESFDGPPSNAIFAGGGFIYVAPDYLGLGGSTVPRHRYFHAASEASSGVDLLAAAKKVLRDIDVRQNDDLYIFGFSQGGHSALALERELEADCVDVKKTATSGGVFDVERFFLSAIKNEETATLPLYVTYTLLAYDDVYDVFGSTSTVFRQPYAGTVEGLFDMQQYFDDVVAGLPATSKLLLKPAYYNDLKTNPNNALRVRMRQNAVDRWRPGAPLRAYHSPEDEEVFYADAEDSIRRINNHGGNARLVDIDGQDHINTWIRAMPRAAAWFKQ